MPVPSNIDELLEMIDQEIIDNNSGLIEENNLRYVLNQLVKILDTKFSLFSPTSTSEQLAMWKNLADFKASDSLGVISSSTVFPNAKSWGFAAPGTYANADDIVIAPNNIGIITYNGSEWNVVQLSIPVVSQNIRLWTSFESNEFPLATETQVIHNDSYYIVDIGQTAFSTDIPGVSNKWIVVSDKNLEKFIKGDYNDITTGEDLTPNLATALTANYTYYHLDSLISDDKEFKELSVKIYVGGTMDLVLINTSNILIHSEEKTVGIGVNTPVFTDISSVPKPYYVGVRPKTAVMRSVAADTTNRMWISPAGVATPLGYKIQYNVTIREKTNAGLVDKVEENTIAVGQISNLATEINGVFQNQTTGEDLTQTFLSALSANYIYYYKNSLISGTTVYNGTDVKVHTAGTLDLILLGMSNEVILSEEKAVGIGINSIDFTNISSIPKPYYIGVRPKTAVLRGLTGGDVTNNVWISPTGVVAALNYKVPYTVKKSVETILGLNSKFDSIGILVQSDTTLLQKSINNKDKTALVKNQYNVEAELIVPDGRTLEGAFGKSVLKAGVGYAGNILKIEDRQDINLKNIKITGNLADYLYGANGVTAGTNIISDIDQAIANTFIGNQNGILIKNTDKIITEGLQFSNLSGTAMKVDRVGRDYIYGMKASKVFITNCYKGFESVNESEYSNFTDFMVSLCQIGVDINSGNQTFSGLQNTRCRIGTLIRGDGINHAHGLFNGSQIKHHQLAGLVFDNVTNGENFNGLSMQYANLVFRSSTMVTIPHLFFTNGKIQCTNPDKLTDGVTPNPQFKTGKNVITKLDFKSGGGFAIENSGNLIIENSRDMTL